MKQFKKIDWMVQVLLLVMVLCWNLAGIWRENFLGNEPFIIPYFVVGAWQIMNVIVHTVQPIYNKKILRRIYLFVLFAAIAGALVSFIMGDGVLIFFYVLLFAAPAMAVYYCIVCIIETKAIKNAALTGQL